MHSKFGNSSLLLVFIFYHSLCLVTHKIFFLPPLAYASLYNSFLFYQGKSLNHVLEEFSLSKHGNFRSFQGILKIDILFLLLLGFVTVLHGPSVGKLG